jgi:hypothetical protein
MLPDVNVGNFPEQRFAGPLGHAETLNLQPQPKATKKAATNPVFASLWRKRVGEVNKGSKEDLALSACSWLASLADIWFRRCVRHSFSEGGNLDCSRDYREAVRQIWKFLIDTREFLQSLPTWFVTNLQTA